VSTYSTSAPLRSLCFKEKTDPYPELRRPFLKLEESAMFHLQYHFKLSKVDLKPKLTVYLFEEFDLRYLNLDNKKTALFGYLSLPKTSTCRSNEMVITDFHTNPLLIVINKWTRLIFLIFASVKIFYLEF